MSKQKSFAGSVLALVLIVAIFIGAMFGLNCFTGPIIESNGSAAAYAPLFAVMPEAEDFEQIYDINAAADSALVDVPETVQAVYAETSGLGYAVKLATTKGYTGQPIELTMAVDNEGKICGIQVDAYPETKDFGAEYPLTYIGQDSAMADVTLVAGITYSSVAFRDAVTDGFNALIANELIGAGQKGDAQILMELLPSVFPGIANSSGVLQYDAEAQASGKYIRSVMPANNGSGVAYIVSDGSGTYLAVVNLAGSVKLVDVNGADVTASADAALLAEVRADAAGRCSTFTDTHAKKAARLVSDKAKFTQIALDGVYNTVTDAFSVKDGSKQLYVFVSRSYGYANEIMTTYLVLDKNGAIVTMTADELIFHKEYFSAYELDEASYKAGFQGVTADSYTGDEAIISGATMSSDAVKTGVRDIFDAFETLKQNGGIGA